jgi:general stress protein YciG
MRAADKKSTAREASVGANRSDGVNSEAESADREHPQETSHKGGVT